MVKKFNSDVDIDIADRDILLSKIKHVSAKIVMPGETKRHPSGIYVTPIPYDAQMGCSAIDFKTAQDRGYFKLDLLNVWVYRWVESEEHLNRLMSTEPNWKMLNDFSTVKKLIHLNNHYSSLRRMSQPVDSIPRLAMFLALIRPSKKHLIGQPWSEIAKTIWLKDQTGYTFKKSHSLAYAHLIVVHMNLLQENPNAYNAFDDDDYNSKLFF